MEINPDFVSPCGLYCGVCAIYIAYRENNEKFKERLVGLYQGGVPGKGSLPDNERLTTESIHCHGCMSDDLLRLLPQLQDPGLRERERLYRMPSVRRLSV